MSRTVACLAALTTGLLGAADAPPKKAAVVWTTDLNRMKVPDSPVAGKIHGKDFKLVFADLPKGATILRLGQGKDFPEETIDINLWQHLKAGESPQGKKFEVDPGKPNPRAPGVIVTYLQPRQKLPSTQMVVPGEYAMKLEFGKKNQGKIPGKIYFALVRDRETYVAGTFELKEQ
jgi:hypothetical protein